MTIDSQLALGVSMLRSPSGTLSLEFLLRAKRIGYYS